MVERVVVSCFSKENFFPEKEAGWKSPAVLPSAVYLSVLQRAHDPLT